MVCVGERHTSETPRLHLTTPDCLRIMPSVTTAFAWPASLATSPTSMLCACRVDMTQFR
jgi:hypothetical protein